MPLSFSRQKYNAIPSHLPGQDAQNCPVLEENKSPLPTEGQPIIKKWHTGAIWMLLLGTQQANVCMDSGYKIAGRNTDLKKTSAYSPILDEVDLDLEPYKLNGAVTDNTSIFRADPSPEVDAAWDNLATEGFELITVSSSDLARAGISATSSVKAPMSWGRGSDAYIAQIDVFHQIHCLNELRKEIHYDYYYKPGYGDRPPPQHMIHKKHCIHILLQNIMCHADVDIVAHNWVHYGNIHQEGRPYAEPLADFSIVKQCRRFDRLLAWAKEEAVDNLSKKWQGLRPPEGAVILDGTGGYF